MPGSNPDPQIGGVLPQQRIDALKLVFGHLQLDERDRQIGEALVGAPPASEGPLEGLIGARRNGRLVGAMFSQIASGRTAIVWLPRLVAGEPGATTAGLYAATWEFLAQRGIVLAQVVLLMVGKVERAVLRLGGFRHLTNLFYLVSQLDDRSSVGGWGRHSCLPRTDKADKNVCPTVADKSLLDFEPYSTSCSEQWAEVFRATCQQTLDCPGLGDGQTFEDRLADYRSSIAPDPNLWLLARHGQRAVGCLLLADRPRQENMELVYLGLIPAARGRGWGKQLARHAQWLARCAGRRRLVLAVDAGNAPAIQTYTGVGFEAWQQRKLYVRNLIVGTVGLNRLSTVAAHATRENLTRRAGRVEGVLR